VPDPIGILWVVAPGAGGIFYIRQAHLRDRLAAVSATLVGAFADKLPVHLPVEGRNYRVGFRLQPGAEEQPRNQMTAQVQRVMNIDQKEFP
jgi:hypothetical protein